MALYHATPNGLAERAVHTVKRGPLRQTAGDIYMRDSAGFSSTTEPHQSYGYLPYGNDVQATIVNKI